MINILVTFTTGASRNIMGDKNNMKMMKMKKIKIVWKKSIQMMVTGLEVKYLALF